MSATVVGNPALGSERTRRHSRAPRWAIAGHVARAARRGALIWGTVFGVWIVSTVEAFVRGYPTRAERQELAQSLQAFASLLGVPRHADTVGGFTQWRVLVAIAVIGAIWGLLTSTSLLRGEEEAGRWELLLSGPTTRGAAAAQALLGLAGALATMFLPTALLAVAAGRLPGAHASIGGSLLFAVALVAGAAMFLAVGAVAGEIGATRGQAIQIAAAVLGVSYVVRMIADSRTSLGWLRWLSPIGWVEALRPWQDPQPWALAPILGLVLGCAGLTVLLAGRRDLGAGVLREREAGVGDGRWLRGPTSLALRLSGASALAWLGGLAGLAAVYGSLARSAGGILSGSPAFTAALGRLGVRQATEGYLGVVFLMVDVLIAVLAAAQVAAIRDEEAAGRLENLLVGPVRRTTWLVGRLGLSLALVLLVGLAAGLFTRLGMASQHVYMSLPTLLEAGLNAAVPGVFVLGAGTLVFGLRPRLSAVASYGIVAWSFLVDLLGALVKGNDWLRDSSLFTHIALAPAAKPDWGTSAIIVALGVAAAIVGVVAFQRRDLEAA